MPRSGENWKSERRGRRKTARGLTEATAVIDMGRGCSRQCQWAERRTPLVLRRSRSHTHSRPLAAGRHARLGTPEMDGVYFYHCPNWDGPLSIRCFWMSTTVAFAWMSSPDTMLLERDGGVN